VEESLADGRSWRRIIIGPAQMTTDDACSGIDPEAALESLYPFVTARVTTRVVDSGRCLPKHRHGRDGGYSPRRGYVIFLYFSISF